MPTRLAIHPFDRCGRLIFRALVERGLLAADPPITLAAVAGVESPEVLAHLLKYDSTHAPFPGTVAVDADDEALWVNSARIPVITCGSSRSEEFPWGDLDVSHVIETRPESLWNRDPAIHLSSGARRVLVAGHGRKDDFTAVMGVNHQRYDPVRHLVVSAALPTITASAPVLKVLNDHFGIERGFATHLRSPTEGSNLLDTAGYREPNLRRIRAAAINVIPATRGYIRAIYAVIPELSGKLHSHAYFVPSQAVSVLDLCVRLHKNTSVEEIHAAFREAAAGPPLRGVLELCDEPLVSRDFLHRSASCTFDTGLTQMLGGDFVKLVAWHDAEWAYACRVVDLLRWMVAAERW